MDLPPRKRFILYTITAYLLFGSAWILLSDRLLLAFTDVAALTRLSTAKGLTFIVLTALLLLLALLHIPDRREDSGPAAEVRPLVARCSEQLPWWVGYGFAAVVTVAMLVVRRELTVSFGERPMLILFVVPIVLSSTLGGFGPGLLATLIAALGTDFFFIPPIGAFAIGKPHDLLQWSMLIATGLLTSFLNEQLHRARRQAEYRRLLQEQAQEEILRLNRELEQRVAERTADLTAANTQLEGFTYAVSHDLRAPLRAITGFSQALVEDYSQDLKDEAKLYLSHIINGSRRMGELIDGLLTLSRSSRGPLQRRTIDLTQLAARIVEELRAEEPERRVLCEIEPELTVQGDAAMVEVMMRNLLSNGWKYTSRRKEARIRVFSRIEAGQRFFCVQDNGAGFDMAYADKLFHPFQRLHRQEEFPGIGIGLATVQRIVLRHGGSLEARGMKDGGATFCFTLPLSANPVREEP